LLLPILYCDCAFRFLIEGVNEMLKISLKAALLASCSIGTVGAATAQTLVRQLPPVTANSIAATTLPPELRYQVAAYLPTEPEAFVNESDEKGYCSGATENPYSN
jgi:hypothetical protein